jgi:hypothetical protein
MAGPNLANLSRPRAITGRVPNVYRVTLSELRGHRGIFPLVATFRVLAALVQMLVSSDVCRGCPRSHVHRRVSRTEQ